jgi:hypothetical protein
MFIYSIHTTVTAESEQQASAISKQGFAITLLYPKNLLKLVLTVAQKSSEPEE